VWSAASSALQSLTQKAPSFEKALTDARARGELHPDVKAAAAAWIATANALMARMADVISGSPELRASLDTAGPTVGFAGVPGWGGGLAAYFGELEAVADKAIELLRAPLTLPSTLQGLGQGIPPQLASLAARLGASSWARLMELLRLPIVTAAGAVAVGGKVLNDAVNGETEAYLAHEAALDQLVAEGKLTVEEYNALKKKIPEKESIIGPIVLGVVALGGLALYLKSRKES